MMMMIPRVFFPNVGRNDRNLALQIIGQPDAKEDKGPFLHF